MALAPVLSLLVIVSLSLLVTRIAAVALVHTGLGIETARFQARSAFSGVGFTTSEAEAIVSHPVRRRIVMALMLMGNVGIVAAMSSLLLSFLGMQLGAGALLQLGMLAAGVLVLALLASSAWVDRHVSRAISWALNRWTSIDARDYARLLHLREDYGVSELAVEPGDWIVGRTLAAAGLVQEGILVLGIECRKGTFVGAPPGDAEVRAGDRLVLYGRTPRIAALDRRHTGEEGERCHAEGIAEQAAVCARERALAGR